MPGAFVLKKTHSLHNLTLAEVPFPIPEMGGGVLVDSRQLD